MFRNIGIGAATVLAVGALAIGCSEDGDTILGGGSLTTDNYPGSQIQDSNVADDGRAFTNQGQTLVDDELEIYWNVTNGTAIALYQLETDNGTNLLYASSFNGTRWSEPVQIRGRDLSAATDVFEDPNEEVDGYKVLWLNTASSTIPEVAARNGDAIILFRRDDLDQAPGQTSSEEDANSRLWMTYFDVSAAALPAQGTVVRGFNTDAITVDDDVFFGTPSGQQDANVSTFGFVSDSHQGTHVYSSGVDAVDSGEPTNFVSLVYRKADSATTGDRYLTKAIIGDAVDNDLAALLGSEEEIVGGIATTTTESVVEGFTTHNELMLWQNLQQPNGYVDGGEEGDTPLFATTFDEDGPIDSAVVSNTPINNDSADTVSVQALYGPDQDLAAFYVVFTESGFGNDNTQSTGDRDDDTDLFVAQIDADDALTVQRAKIENFQDTLELTTQPLRAGTNTGVSNVQTRLNRSADFITILYREVNTDVTTLTGGATPNVNTLLYVTAVQTRRASTFGDTTTRALADSVFDSVAGGDFTPIQVPAFVSTGDTGTLASDEFDVFASDAFQQDLVGWLAVSQNDDDLSPMPGCAIQSNAFRVNFLYTQVQDSTGSSSDLDDLLVNGILFTPGVLVDESPDVDLVDTSREVVDTRDTGYGVGFDAVAVDAGDVTRDATGAPDGDSGRVLVFYRLNGNNPTSDPSEPNTAAFTETRLFVYDAGDNQLVSTDGPREFDQVDEMIGIETVPVNEDFRNSPHHAGTTLHVFWTESVNSGSEQRIVTRSYDKGAINDGATTNDALATRFTPNLVSVATGDDPVQIDLLTDGTLFDVQENGASDEFVTNRSGSTVGVYFAEDEHVYYSDTASDATGWDYENGIPAPQLVDNDSPTGVRVIAWRVHNPPECDDLPKGMVIFVRDNADQLNTNANFDVYRAYVRIHN